MHQSFGRGLMPDTFIDYKKQRFRWAYGAMQIMKFHARSLFLGKGSQLTRGQRYHFIAGWLPWIADGLNLFFTIGALLWSAAMIIVPQQDGSAADDLRHTAAGIVCIFKFGKIMFLYRRAVGVDLKRSFQAAIAGLALSHTIAKAVLYGAFTENHPVLPHAEAGQQPRHSGSPDRSPRGGLHHASSLGRRFRYQRGTGFPQPGCEVLGWHAARAVAALCRRAVHGTGIVHAPTGNRRSLKLICVTTRSHGSTTLTGNPPPFRRHCHVIPPLPAQPAGPDAVLQPAAGSGRNRHSAAWPKPGTDPDRHCRLPEPDRRHTKQHHWQCTRR
jgi:hypothetical protein